MTKYGEKGSKNINILIADDHPLNLDLAERIFTKLGCNVTKTTSGIEAINNLKNSQEGFYQVVILDYNMPIETGLETAKKIRLLNRTDVKDLKIYLMSGDINFYPVEKIKEDEIINGILDKPFDREIIKDLVEELKETL